MILELADRDEAERILIAHQRMDPRSCLCGWNPLGQLHAAHQVEQLDAAGLFRERAPEAPNGDEDADEDDAFPVGPVLMWLIYKACETCGAEAKQPCVGSPFGPHEGRPRRWEVLP
jgi:hypothetical protein